MQHAAGCTSFDLLLPVTSNSVLHALIYVSLRTDMGNTNLCRSPMMHDEQQTLDSYYSELHQHEYSISIQFSIFLRVSSVATKAYQDQLGDTSISSHLYLDRSLACHCSHSSASHLSSGDFSITPTSGNSSSVTITQIVELREALIDLSTA